MSNDDQPEEASTPEQASEGPVTVEEINTIPDPILKAMASVAAHNESFELGITLHVSGLVISGIMISPAKFYNNLGGWLAKSGSEGFADSFALPTAALAAENPDQPTFNSFLHLRNAKVFLSGNQKPLPDTFWRGRLSHVSAWSIGAMEFTEW